VQVIEDSGNPYAILNMYHTVWTYGVESEARGQKTRNLRNLAIVLDAGDSVLTSFTARKLNLDYCKKEWLWYLGADKYDSSIAEHAKMWLKLQQADGSYHSNYGQYIFTEQMPGRSQFWYCVEQLLRDQGTRRASMVLLKQDHLYHENTDTVCTYAINFAIEQHQLHMTVMMRSNDVIFGFTNDAFCFHQLYKLVYAMVAHQNPKIRHGSYTHFANSMHVYERHYEMIQDLVSQGIEGYTKIEEPWPTAGEATDLVLTRGRAIVGPYSQWLNE
jgi:thymidylate synthase